MSALNPAATEQAGALSRSELRVARHLTPVGRNYSDPPDADFDPARRQGEVDERLAELVMDMPATDLLEFLSEMDEADKYQLRAKLHALRRHTSIAAAADLGKFIDRLWAKWNTETVEKAMSRPGLGE